MHWCATTLNPFYEKVDETFSVLDHRFIKCPILFNNWFFSDSNTGDILDKEYDNCFQNFLSKHYEKQDSEIFDLVTGDGGFSCIGCEDRQEELTFQLIFKEVMIGIKFLKNNGTLVIKFFTFFNCETISLLYLICNCFEQVTVYKPVASKRGNSEVYLVCINFNRNEFEILNSSVQNINSEEFILCRNLIPEEFISNLFSMTQQLATRQSNHIQNNIDRFQNHFNIKTLDKEKQRLFKLFTLKFNLFPIPINDQLTIVHDDPRYYSDDYSYQKLLNNFEKKQDYNEFVEKLCSKLAKKFVSKTKNENCLTSLKTSTYKICVKFVHGKPYRTLNNSMFCHSSLLKIYNIIRCSNLDKGMTKSNDNLQCFIQIFLPLTPIYFNENSLFSELILKSTVSMNFNDLFYVDNKPTELSCTTIHYVDLYDLIDCVTSNDYIVCDELKNRFKNLIDENVLRSNDILVIRFKILLSRLSVGLTVLLCQAFKQFCAFSLTTEIDTSHSSLYCVLINYCSLTKDLELIINDFDNWNNSLLEIVNVPLLLHCK